MTKWELLRKRLKEECDFEVGEEFRRCYPGRHQRSAGAWSWVTTSKKTQMWNVGSQWSMTELLKADNITVDLNRVTYDYWIEPEWED